MLSVLESLPVDRQCSRTKLGTFGFPAQVTICTELTHADFVRKWSAPRLPSWDWPCGLWLDDLGYGCALLGSFCVVARCFLLFLCAFWKARGKSKELNIRIAVAVHLQSCLFHVG